MIDNLQELMQSCFRQISEEDFLEKYTIEHRSQIRGGQAHVKFAVNRKGQKVALKIFSKQSIKQNWRYVQKEVQIMQKIHHQNIVSFIQAVSIKYQNGSSDYILILEKCQSELGQSVSIISKQREIQKLKVFKDLALGVEYLHLQNIIHRDLKPQNILIKDKVYKIADLGLSRYVEADSNGMEMSCVGNMLYCQQNIFKQGIYNATCDIYSLGLIFYLLTTGQNLFSKAFTSQREFEEERSKILSALPTYLAQIPNEIKNIILSCFNNDPIKNSATNLRQNIEKTIEQLERKSDVSTKGTKSNEQSSFSSPSKHQQLLFSSSKKKRILQCPDEQENKINVQTNNSIAYQLQKSIQENIKPLYQSQRTSPKIKIKNQQKTLAITVMTSLTLKKKQILQNKEKLRKYQQILKKIQNLDKHIKNIVNLEYFESQRIIKEHFLFAISINIYNNALLIQNEIKDLSQTKRNYFTQNQLQLLKKSINNVYRIEKSLIRSCNKISNRSLFKNDYLTILSKVIATQSTIKQLVQHSEIVKQLLKQMVTTISPSLCQNTHFVDSPKAIISQMITYLIS